MPFRLGSIPHGSVGTIADAARMSAYATCRLPLEVRPVSDRATSRVLEPGRPACLTPRLGRLRSRPLSAKFGQDHSLWALGWQYDEARWSTDKDVQWKRTRARS